MDRVVRSVAGGASSLAVRHGASLSSALIISCRGEGSKRVRRKRGCSDLRAPEFDPGSAARYDRFHGQGPIPLQHHAPARAEGRLHRAGSSASRLCHLWKNCGRGARNGQRGYLGLYRQSAEAQRPDSHRFAVIVLSQLPPHLKFRVLEEHLAVCRLSHDAPLPTWALEEKFFCVVRTRDELSIVCSEKACTASQIPDGAAIEHGWIGLRLEGPFPFSMTGVLASFLQPLAEAQIPIFAISTFDTDYVLIKQEDLESAVMALTEAGHSK